MNEGNNPLQTPVGPPEGEAPEACREGRRFNTGLTSVARREEAL